ncbi:hypothetical protein QBC47DRAFT_464491 [Echria macrotheca]|uniref:C2H2-type domain-containing protein n=1 Tax=Echria macrotheca TaxID=438768 RepID=A0AAJ0B645_9PEZI|nr:hypothetical protein QBC47DRAFT_464491 [Echria macrotheca]
MLPFRPSPGTNNPNIPTVTGDSSPGKQATDNLPTEYVDESGHEIPQSPSLSAVGDLEGPVLHLVGPPSVHPAASIMSSDTMPSSGGNTFSTLGGLSLGQASMFQDQAPTESLLLNMSPHPISGEDIRDQPLEVECVGGASEPDPDPEHPPLFPWRFQFSWGEGTDTRAAILFNEESLDISPDLDGHVSEAAVAVVASDTEFLAPSVVLSATTATTAISEPSCDSEAGTDLLEETAFKWGDRKRVIMERRTWLFRLLYDHFLRTFPPLRPARRTRRAAGPLSGTSTSTASPGAGSGNESRRSQGSSARGRKITGGSGEEEEGEDGEDGDGPSPPASSQPQRTRTDRLFACPYLKWDAVEYACCGAGYRRVCDVKAHLAKAHYALSCPTCHSVYDSKSLLRHHQRMRCAPGTRPAPTSRVLTAEQLARIREHGSGSPEEQWRRVFRIIFPGHPDPFSIYLEGLRLEIFFQYGCWLDNTGRYTLRVFQRQEHAFEDPGFAPESWAQQREGVLDLLSDRVYRDAAAATGLLGSAQPPGPAGLQGPVVWNQPPLNNPHSADNNDLTLPPADSPTTGTHLVTQPVSDPATLEMSFGNPDSGAAGWNLTASQAPLTELCEPWLQPLYSEAPWSPLGQWHVQEAGPSNGRRPEECEQGA